MPKKIFLSVVSGMLFFISFLPAQNVKATMAPRPDLAISNFWNWPKNPTSREWFDIKVRIYNLSETDLKTATAVHIFVGGSNKPYILSLGPLSAKKSRDLIQRVLLSTPGKYVARAIVDPQNKILEINENNNSKRLNFRIKKAASSEFLPDLNIYPPSYKPVIICDDTRIEFKATITNNGAVRAPRSKAAIKVGGGPPVLLDVPAIKPGEYKRVKLTKILPRAGNYIVKAYADYGNRIREYDEGNNEKSKNFTVYDNCCPDLSVSNNYIWIWPKNPKAGDKFDLRVRIFNIGKKVPAKSTTLEIYVGGSTTPYVFNVSPIQPHKERTFDQEISLGRPGKYRVRVIVDPRNRIKECKENNNRGHLVFRVK